MFLGSLFYKQYGPLSDCCLSSSMERVKFFLIVNKKKCSNCLRALCTNSFLGTRQMFMHEKTCDPYILRWVTQGPRALLETFFWLFFSFFQVQKMPLLHHLAQTIHLFDCPTFHSTPKNICLCQSFNALFVESVLAQIRTFVGICLSILERNLTVVTFVVDVLLRNPIWRHTKRSTASRLLNSRSYLKVELSTPSGILSGKI